MLQRSLGADRIRRICLNDFLKLRPGERVLDIGCGPGYILDYMPRVDYVGFDTEPRYIEYAKKRFPDRGQFFCEHFDLEHVQKLALISMQSCCSGSYITSTTALRNTLLRLLAQVMSPKGRVVTADACFTPDQSYLARWVAKSDRGQFVRNVPAYRSLFSEYFEIVESTIFHNTGRIPSTEVITRMNGLTNAKQKTSD